MNGEIFYGRLGLKAVVVQVSKKLLTILISVSFVWCVPLTFSLNTSQQFADNIQTIVYKNIAMTFDDHWDLKGVDPMARPTGWEITFQIYFVGVQKKLTETAYPVISCPVSKSIYHSN